VVNYILRKGSLILGLFEKFVKFTADITLAFIKFLERP